MRLRARLCVHRKSGRPSSIAFHSPFGLTTPASRPPRVKFGLSALSVSDISTLYRFVDGELRADGTKLLKRKGQHVSS
jgi:hypothetical protein